jgi:hypothetical protein
MSDTARVEPTFVSTERSGFSFTPRRRQSSKRAAATANRAPAARRRRVTPSQECSGV